MKRKIFLIIISILILTLSILGLTYAFMKPKVEKKQESTNISINSCAKVQLKDDGKVINLENTYPMDNDMGLETESYEFTVSSTCEDYVGFNLYLTSLSDNKIADNNIHFAITSKNKDVLSEGILTNQENGVKDFNTEELKELDFGINGTHKNIYKVYSNNLPLQSESNYQLYLWLDKDANNETMGKSFKVGLSLKSYNREETGAEKLIATSNEDKTLYFHNENLVGGAMDNSYRYAGANEEVKNFVCLDGNITSDGVCENNDADLYRIIGLFKNDLNLYEMKLIKYDYATTTELGNYGAYSGNSYSFGNTLYKGNIEKYPEIGGYYWTANNNETNSWMDSELRKTNLNSFYIDYLKNTKHLDVDKMITNHPWIFNGYNNDSITPKVMYNSEMNKYESDSITSNKVENRIGLMYISDYGYAAAPISTNNWSDILHDNTTIYTSYTLNNWMYMGLSEWTISPNTSTSNLASGISGYGYAAAYSVNTGAHSIRPCFYLRYGVQIKDGEGTKEKPYRLTFD